MTENEEFSLALQPGPGEIKYKHHILKIEYIGQGTSEVYYLVTAKIPIFPSEDELVTLCDNSRRPGQDKDNISMARNHFGGRTLPMLDAKQKYVIVYKD